MIKFTFIFIILYWLLAQPKGEKAVNRYITFCAILFIAMMGLRNEAIFGDTYLYVDFFKDLNHKTLSSVINDNDRDYSFWVVSYFLNKILSGNYTLWLLLIAVLFMLPVLVLIRRYPVEPMYSWILFIYLGFMYFTMAGLRQTVAMSFTMTGFLILLDNNREKKARTIRFILLISLASLFHSSALICLVGVLFLKRPFRWSTLTFYFLALLFGLFLGRGILQDVTLFLGKYDERYMLYGNNMIGSTYTYLLQQLIVVIPSMIVLKQKFHDPFIMPFFHFSIIGLLFVSLSPFIAEMFRLSYYFSWANLVIFPMAINSLRKKAPFAISFYLLFFIVYLIFINGTAWEDYYFWFEDTRHLIQQML